MKKIVLTAAIVLGMVSANAQQVKFGIKAGVNIASIANTSENALNEVLNEKNKSLIGYNVGAFAEINLSEQLAIQPELIFSAQGGKREYDIKIAGAKATRIIKAQTNYIQIPVMGKFYVMDALALEFGPQVGFLLSAENVIETDVEGTGIASGLVGGVINAAAAATDGLVDGTKDIKTKTNQMDFGVNFGASYNMTDNLSIGARYSLGLTDTMNKDDREKLFGKEKDAKTTNRNIMVSVGFSF